MSVACQAEKGVTEVMAFRY